MVAHFVCADWELEKRVIGLRLIDVMHSGINIAERIESVVTEYGLNDKIFAVTLDNISSNSSAVANLRPKLIDYLGSEPEPLGSGSAMNVVLAI
jgi:hypothetical protein